MPSAILATTQGRYAVLEGDLPRWGTTVLGILLEDPVADRVHIRLRRDWEEIAGEDAELFEALEDDLNDKASEMGAAALFAWLEDTLSNTVRVTDREPVLVYNFEQTLNRLYARHVQSSERRGVTHVPRYSLRVAAGRLLDNEEIESEAGAYEEVPKGLRVTPDLFAAEIVGTSMEPMIPNGSVCLFRKFGAGTRQGKYVLVEELGRGTNDRYTVKRYYSHKQQRPDGTWDHDWIRLEPLNPEHQAWYLDPQEERYRILAEFVEVLY